MPDDGAVVQKAIGVIGPVYDTTARSLGGRQGRRRTPSKGGIQKMYHRSWLLCVGIIP
jgi:hypothetical protein